MFDVSVAQDDTGRLISLCNQAADHLADANRVLNESPEDIAWAVARIGMALRCLRDCEIEVIENAPSVQVETGHVVWSPAGIGWRVGTAG